MSLPSSDEFNSKLYAISDGIVHVITRYKAVSLGSIIIIGSIIIVSMVLSVFQSTQKLSKELKKETSPISSNIKHQAPKPTPTATAILIAGKISCLPEVKDTCVIGIKTVDGTFYKLHTPKEKDLLAFIPGKEVQIQGILLSSNTTNPQQTSSGTDIYVNSPQSNTPSTLTPTATPPLLNIIILPSSTPTPTPISTPVPSPTFTPTPTTAPPGNVKQIVDNVPSLNGQTVSLSGYLISGNIGQDACVYLGLCDYSIITLANTPGYDPDPRYNIDVRISKNEKESNYVIGQRIDISAQITEDNGTTIFEKVY